MFARQQQPGGVASYSNFEYIYQYKDHLGNVRLSYLKDAATGNLQVVEEENYYAFGMKHAGYNNLVTGLGNPSGQKLEYNGKEFQDELGFKMYDYGARNYDATLGRWMNIDPLAEISRRWSPYNYCYNNPVVFVDPDGMKVSLSSLITAFGNALMGSLFGVQQSEGAPKAVELDTESGGFEYAAEKDAYEAMAATGNGGGPGGGFWDWLFGRKNQSTVTLETMEPATIVADEPTFVDRFFNLFNFMQPSTEASDARANDMRVFFESANKSVETASYFHSVMLTLMTLPIGGEGGEIVAVGKAATSTEIGAYSVYEGLEAGTVRYIGITSRDATIRFGEHASSGTARSLLDYRVIDGATGLSKTQARVFEQQLINKFGLQKNGGQLVNKINSISPGKWSAFGVIP